MPNQDWARQRHRRMKPPVPRMSGRNHTAEEHRILVDMILQPE